MTPRTCFKLPSRHWAYPWIAALAGVVMLARAASTVHTFNHTTDEPAHIAAAVSLYEAHKAIYMIEHPPLQRLVVGGALRLAGAELWDARGESMVQSRHGSNFAGGLILFYGPVPYWRVLVVARLANLLFPALAMFFLYRLGKWLANPLVAMLSVVFFSVDPTLLAHGGLAGTDVAAAAGFLMVTYHGLRLVAKPTWKRALVAGVALGLGLSCKFTCVFAIPALGLLLAARAVRAVQRRPAKIGSSVRAFRRVWPSVGQIATVAGVAFVILWGTYLFDIGRLNDQALFENEQAWRAVPLAVKDAMIPMPSMVLGNMFLATLSRHGFRCYLNGHVGISGGWYYFIEAIGIKSPIGMLLAFVIALGVFAFSRNRHPWKSLAILLPPSILLLVSSAGKLQIGIRHVLPVLPFMYLFAAFHLHRGRRVVLLMARWRSRRWRRPQRIPITFRSSIASWAGPKRDIYIFPTATWTGARTSCAGGAI